MKVLAEVMRGVVFALGVLGAVTALLAAADWL